MKKLFIFGIMVLLLTLTSCNQLITVRVDKEDLADWDGNYIYYKDKVCKTTGEDEVTLFESFVGNDAIYTHDDYYIVDHIFIDNYLYCIAAIKSSDLNFVLKYSITDNKVEAIHTAKFELNRIFAGDIKNLYIGGDELYKLDLTNYQIDYIDVLKSYAVLDDMIVFSNNDGIYLYDIVNETSTFLSDDFGYNRLKYKLCETNNNKIIIIENYNNSYDYINLIIMYDIKNKKISLYNTEDFEGKYLIAISNEYYFAGEENLVDHIDSNDKHVYENEEFYSNLDIYKIDYDESSECFKFNLLHEIDDKYAFKGVYLYDNIIYMRLKYLKKYNESYDTLKYKDFKYSLEKNKFSNSRDFNTTLAYVPPSTSIYIEYSEYTYYFQKKLDESIFFIYYDYYLYREKEGKTEILQYSNDIDDHNKFRCASFIEYCSTETRKNRILITNFKYNKKHIGI